MDGFELAVHLKKMLAPGSFRMVALTGFSQESVRRRSAELGFADCLVKPVTMDRLVSAVRR